MSTFLHSLLKRKVFANSIMLMFLAGGLISSMVIRQELFPEMEEREIQIAVELPGASPDDITTSVLFLIENAVRGLDGIKHVDSEASEGIGIVSISLLDRVDTGRLLGDVKNAVDRITSFPQDAEKPVISVPSMLEKALSIVVSGNQPLMWLYHTAESIRDDLRTELGLKKAELAFPYNPEISVEIPEKILREYGLTLEDIAMKIKANSPDLPGGNIFSDNSDIALRTSERREWANDFSDIVITQTDSGRPLKLADIADLKDTFGEFAIESWFNGNPAILINVFAVGDESPISVEEKVKEYFNSNAKEKYKGVEITIFENEADAYRSRMSLLISNALIGLVLVIFILGIFLSPRLAFWVMAGIPASLLGGLLMLPLFNASLNMISLFAFIVTIGVVVDDAIMMGEAIHSHRSKGMDHLSAAVMGFKEMCAPIIMATLTTILAFMPMFFVPGSMGVVFRQIPAVIVAVLLVSMVESVFILSVHLADGSHDGVWIKVLSRPQQLFNDKLELFIQGRFKRFINVCLKYPAASISVFVSLFLITTGGIAGGLLGFSFTPAIESDTVIAQAALPYGSPRSESVRIQERIVEAACRVLKGNKMNSEGIFSLIGTRLEEGEIEVETLAGSHYISVLSGLPPGDQRKISGPEFAKEWQNAFGDRGGLEALNFTGETKITGGEPIRLDVFHPDENIAKKTASLLGESMRKIPGLSSIDDGIHAGKPQLKLRFKKNDLQMGITAEDMASQIRQRYYGAEAYRFVRDSSEIKVMVKLTEKERRSSSSLQEVMLENQYGALVPLSEVAEITRTQTPTSLVRRDGKRVFPVTADIMTGISDDFIEEELEEKILPSLLEKFPGVSITFGGEEEEIDDALGVLGKGFLVVLGIMYLMLTLYFNSFKKSLLVLLVIPFSFIGAVWGHIILGYDLSIVSIMGIIAMTGVVVNDSLVLVTTFNRNLREDMTIHQGI
ncbi:MAG: efflux RND transporter permease subunit, partial [Desulfobacteraceae bacterium]